MEKCSKLEHFERKNLIKLYYEEKNKEVILNVKATDL